MLELAVKLEFNQQKEYYIKMLEDFIRFLIITDQLNNEEETYEDEEKDYEE